MRKDEEEANFPPIFSCPRFPPSKPKGKTANFGTIFALITRRSTRCFYASSIHFSFLSFFFFPFLQRTDVIISLRKHRHFATLLANPLFFSFFFSLFLSFPLERRETIAFPPSASSLPDVCRRTLSRNDFRVTYTLPLEP